MVDFGKSDKMVKIKSRKVDKSNTYNEFSNNISFFIQGSLKKFFLPRKQRLINRKRHRHTANEGMDSYR